MQSSTPLNAQVYFGLRKIGLPKLVNCGIAMIMGAAENCVILVIGRESLLPHMLFSDYRLHRE
jgi:hypothetical protein